MRRGIVVVGGVLLTAAVLMAQPAAKPDFSGVWVLDKDRSFSNPAGLDQTMTLVHKGSEVSLDAQLKTTAQGEQHVTETWVLDGQTRDFVPAAANAKGTRKASWLPGDRGLLVTDETVTETPKGTQRQVVTRKLMLSADGSTLTIDYYIDNARVSVESKRIFNRQR